MAISDNSDLSYLLKLYLNKDKKFEKNILFPFFSFRGKQNMMDEHLIVSIINEESELENEIRELILSDSQRQRYNTRKLRKFVLQVEKAEERLIFRGNFMLGIFFVLPLTISFLTLWSEFILGDNIYIQIVLLLLFLYLSMVNVSNAWQIKRLASNIKCLRMASQNILDSFSTDT